MRFKGERYLAFHLLVFTFLVHIIDGKNDERKQDLAYVADPAGNPLSRPSLVPAKVGSPSTLIRPDRYEFYTFDETGELIKRLMTLEEIQEIIATGDGDDGHMLTVAQSDVNKPAVTFNFQPPSHVKVHTIVSNVQNVLKAEMEAQKTNPPKPAIFDTPDVSNSWSLILPAIFGNTGGSITTDSLSPTHSEPETDVINNDDDDDDAQEEHEEPLEEVTTEGIEIRDGNDKPILNVSEKPHSVESLEDQIDSISPLDIENISQIVSDLEDDSLNAASKTTDGEAFDNIKVSTSSVPLSASEKAPSDDVIEHIDDLKNKDAPISAALTSTPAAKVTSTTSKSTTIQSTTVKRNSPSEGTTTTKPAIEKIIPIITPEPTAPTVKPTTAPPTVSTVEATTPAKPTSTTNKPTTTTAEPKTTTVKRTTTTVQSTTVTEKPMPKTAQPTVKAEQTTTTTRKPTTTSEKPTNAIPKQTPTTEKPTNVIPKHTTTEKQTATTHKPTSVTSKPTSISTTTTTVKPTTTTTVTPTTTTAEPTSTTVKLSTITTESANDEIINEESSTSFGKLQPIIVADLSSDQDSEEESIDDVQNDPTKEPIQVSNYATEPPTIDNVTDESVSSTLEVLISTTEKIETLTSKRPQISSINVTERPYFDIGQIINQIANDLGDDSPYAPVKNNTPFDGNNVLIDDRLGESVSSSTGLPPMSSSKKTEVVTKPSTTTVTPTKLITNKVITEMTNAPTESITQSTTTKVEFDNDGITFIKVQPISSGQTKNNPKKPSGTSELVTKPSKVTVEENSTPLVTESQEDEEYLESNTAVTDYELLPVTKPTLGELSDSITDLISQIVDDSRPTVIPLSSLNSFEKDNIETSTEPEAKYLETNGTTIFSRINNEETILDDDDVLSNTKTSESISSTTQTASEATTIKSEKPVTEVVNKDETKQTTIVNDKKNYLTTARYTEISPLEEIKPTTYRPVTVFKNSTPLSTTIRTKIEQLINIIESKNNNSLSSSTVVNKNEELQILKENFEKIISTVTKTPEIIKLPIAESSTENDEPLKITINTEKYAGFDSDEVTTVNDIDEYDDDEMETTETSVTQDHELMEMLSQVSEIFKITSNEDKSEESNIKNSPSNKTTAYKKTDTTIEKEYLKNVPSTTKNPKPVQNKIALIENSPTPANLGESIGSLASSLNKTEIHDKTDNSSKLNPVPIKEVKVKPVIKDDLNEKPVHKPETVVLSTTEYTIQFIELPEIEPLIHNATRAQIEKANEKIKSHNDSHTNVSKPLVASKPNEIEEVIKNVPEIPLDLMKPSLKDKTSVEETISKVQALITSNVKEASKENLKADPKDIEVIIAKDKFNISESTTQMIEILNSIVVQNNSIKFDNKTVVVSELSKENFTIIVPDSISTTPQVLNQIKQTLNITKNINETVSKPSDSYVSSSKVPEVRSTTEKLHITTQTPQTTQKTTEYTEMLPEINPNMSASIKQDTSTTVKPEASSAIPQRNDSDSVTVNPVTESEHLQITLAIDDLSKNKSTDRVNEQTDENTWKLVPTVFPHSEVIKHNISNVNKATLNSAKPLPYQRPQSSEGHVVINKRPISQNFNANINLEKNKETQGLEKTTSALGEDVFQFSELCNELAFRYFNAVSSNGVDIKRSLVVSPFAVTSILAMMFLGARGATSGEMNDILKLDDMVTFNPHIVFKNVTESIEVSKKAGIATSALIRELYSDRSKGRLLSFYKDRVQQFYSGHVEEVNFKMIGDVIRRRTNLLVKRQTWGKITEYIKDNNMVLGPPLSVFAANIFQTDCSAASTDGRDGEMYFVVSPTIRQRRLIPVPAVLYKKGFLAGYVPELDATVAAIGEGDQVVSTIFVMPGQQGSTAHGDDIIDLQKRLIDTSFKDTTWSKLLRTLIPRQGLELQIPRLSHRSVVNGTAALRQMGLRDLFNAEKADLRGLNGVANDLYLSDMMLVNTFTTCGEGYIGDQHHVEVYPGEPNKVQRRLWRTPQRPIVQEALQTQSGTDIWEEPRDYQRAFHDPLHDTSYLSMPLHLRPRQARLPEPVQEPPRLKFDRPFMFFVRHNPTGLILHMGRYNPRLLP